MWFSSIRATASTTSGRRGHRRSHVLPVTVDDGRAQRAGAEAVSSRTILHARREASFTNRHVRDELSFPSDPDRSNPKNLRTSIRTHPLGIATTAICAPSGADPLPQSRHASPSPVRPDAPREPQRRRSPERRWRPRALLTGGFEAHERASRPRQTRRRRHRCPPSSGTRRIITCSGGRQIWCRTDPALASFGAGIGLLRPMRASTRSFGLRCAVRNRISSSASHLVVASGFELERLSSAGRSWANHWRTPSEKFFFLFAFKARISARERRRHGHVGWEGGCLTGRPRDGSRSNRGRRPTAALGP